MGQHVPAGALDISSAHVAGFSGGSIIAQVPEQWNALVDAFWRNVDQRD